jgi:AAA domain
MRIAVSGTHCSGKSTLIEDFLAIHPDYEHEPEPYVWLDERTAVPDIDGFHRQLEISVERWRTHAPGARVIGERGPIDFVCYIAALQGDVDSAMELAAAGMAHIDLLVVLPLSEADGIEAPEEEDLELREAMNEQLLELIAGANDLLRGIRIVELAGPPRARLATLTGVVLANA